MLTTSLLLALHDERHAVYADDLQYRLRVDFPSATEDDVLYALRLLKVAGLVHEDRLTASSRWRLADNVTDRATLAGLRVLAIGAGAGEV